MVIAWIQSCEWNRGGRHDIIGADRDILEISNKSHTSILVVV